MPVDQTLSSAAQGAAFGLFPILWIVVNALWVYRMTVRTRHFDVLRRSFGRLSDDPRVQALVVAFCFGALPAALAGFGAPVAICSVMLVALGFDPVRAVVVALVASTAPVASGATGTPVATLAQVTGPPMDSVASLVGRQTRCSRRSSRWAWSAWSTAGADCGTPGCPPRRAEWPSPPSSSPPRTTSPRNSPTSAPLWPVPPPWSPCRTRARRRVRTGIGTDRRAQRGTRRAGPAPEVVRACTPVRPDRRPPGERRPGVGTVARTPGRRQQFGRCPRQDDLATEPDHRLRGLGLAGREGDLLRKVLPWSLGPLLVTCPIVAGQSSPVLSWMLP